MAARGRRHVAIDVHVVIRGRHCDEANQARAGNRADSV